MAFAVPDGRADDDDASMRDDASDKTEYDTYLDDDDDDPMAQLRKNPTVRNLVTVTFTRDEVVSSDMRGESHTCIFDENAGIMLDDTFVKLIAWYDNEWGYSSKVLDMVEYVADK